MKYFLIIFFLVSCTEDTSVKLRLISQFSYDFNGKPFGVKTLIIREQKSKSLKLYFVDDGLKKEIFSTELKGSSDNIFTIMFTRDKFTDSSKLIFYERGVGNQVALADLTLKESEIFYKFTKEMLITSEKEIGIVDCIGVVDKEHKGQVGPPLIDLDSIVRYTLDKKDQNYFVLILEEK